MQSKIQVIGCGNKSIYQLNARHLMTEMKAKND